MTGMFGITHRRTLIRVLSYTVSAFCIAVIFAISGFVSAYKFRMGIEYSYQRALSELSEHVDSIDVALQKGYYAGTSAQLVGLSSQIWAQAGAANSNIAQMPLTSVNLENMTRFISQAGDYANSLSRELAAGGNVTDADRAQIKSLSDSAKKLSAQLADLTGKLQAGRIHLFKSEWLLHSSNIKQTVVQTSAEDGFTSIEKSLSGLPSMIYDGPFSDNVMRKEPQLTKGKADISREQARQNAASFLQISAQSLKDAGETAGTLPTWNFTAGTVSVYVTKAGGYVARFIDTRTPAQSKIDADAAQSRAGEYLKTRQIGSMSATYRLNSRNICTVNFAYTQNGTVCYPDLVKLGVAMDTGDIISFDATGYIMNHQKRTLGSPAVSRAAVTSKLSPALKLQKVTMTVIPTDSGEAYCYEMRCLGENNQTIIDYFNASTGVEQQVLILTDTPGGQIPL